MTATTTRARFEETFLPHLDAAYNLARWLTGDAHDAEDMVQEAYFRALKFYHSFRGGDGKAWFLTVVRRTCYTWLEQHRGRPGTTTYNEDLHAEASDTLDPEKIAFRRADNEMLRQAIDALPVEFREVIVLRELEGLSYQEIAKIAGIPLGTVMSRLARARKQLQQRLAHCLDEE